MSSSLFARVSTNVIASKLLAVFVLLQLSLVFTVEYRHLVDEAVGHLHERSSQHHAKSTSPHRCHNCLTSQPQGETAAWNFHPVSSVAPFVRPEKALVANPLPLFELPAERAPPVPRVPR